MTDLLGHNINISRPAKQVVVLNSAASPGAAHQQQASADTFRHTCRITTISTIPMFSRRYSPHSKPSGGIHRSCLLKDTHEPRKPIRSTTGLGDISSPAFSVHEAVTPPVVRLVNTTISACPPVRAACAPTALAACPRRRMPSCIAAPAPSRPTSSTRVQASAELGPVITLHRLPVRRRAAHKIEILDRDCVPAADQPCGAVPVPTPRRLLKPGFGQAIVNNQRDQRWWRRKLTGQRLTSGSANLKTHHINIAFAVASAR